MEPTMGIIYFRPNRIRYCHCQLCLPTGLHHDLPLPICPGWGGEGNLGSSPRRHVFLHPGLLWTLISFGNRTLHWLGFRHLVSPLKHWAMGPHDDWGCFNLANLQMLGQITKFLLCGNEAVKAAGWWDPGHMSLASHWHHWHTIEVDADKKCALS